MDKAEYNIKLDQIHELVEKQDVQGAVEVAETIDWKRVKSIRTLCMVADIYEANKRLEESKEILLLAYNRSSVGKAILYRMVEISVKLDQLNEAVDYYTDFAKVGRGDNSKYILKYKIYRAKRAPLEEQIAILEEYKAKEYTEQWAYELARLYDRADMQDKCIEACDDLILWFSEGTYVVKAMELKMKYTPLSASQQEKYRNREQLILEPSFTTKVQEVEVPQPSVAIQQFPVLQGMQGHTAGGPVGTAASEAAVTSDVVMPSQYVYPEPTRASSENLQEKLAMSFRDVLSGFNKVKDEVAFTLGKKEDAENDLGSEAEDINDYEVVRDLEPEQIENLSQRSEAPLAKIMEKEPQAEEIPKQMPKEETDDISKILEAAAESIADEVANDKYAKEEWTSEEAEESVVAQEEKVQEAICKTPSDTQEFNFEEQLNQALAAAQAPKESSNNLLNEYFEIPEETAKPVAEALATMPEEPQVAPEEKLAEPEEKLAAPEEKLAEPEEKLAEPEEKLVEPEEKLVEPEEKLAEPEEKLVEPEEKLAEPEEKLAEPEEKLAEPEEKLVEPEEKLAEPEEKSVESEEKLVELEEPVELKEKSVEPEELVTAPEALSLEEQLLQEETPEEKRVRILNDTKPQKLSDEQKKLFSYFAKVPGMDRQLLDALYGAYSYAGEKTSKHGNIAVMGSKGTGKSKLSENLVKAICKDLGVEAAKIGHIDGEAMNEKDPVKVVACLAGGFLLIDNAGAMTDATIDKLSRALEFRTDSMIMLLEDEKDKMRKLLADHQSFAKKIETVISIPVFTNDELVAFARTYAKEMGYRMDEMGVLALYTMIGDNQTEKEPITIAKVKEMVDGAIANTKKVTRKLGRKLAVSSTDEDGHVILYEKDFH